jgi:hypothetical protein
MDARLTGLLHAHLRHTDNLIDRVIFAEKLSHIKQSPLGLLFEVFEPLLDHACRVFDHYAFRVKHKFLGQIQHLILNLSNLRVVVGRISQPLASFRAHKFVMHANRLREIGHLWQFSSRILIIHRVCQLLARVVPHLQELLHGIPVPRIPVRLERFHAIIHHRWRVDQGFEMIFADPDRAKQLLFCQNLLEIGPMNSIGRFSHCHGLLLRNRRSQPIDCFPGSSGRQLRQLRRRNL